ncbi:MAG: DNA repair protein RecN [Deltaproteobacteria bacterium]|jgi:DNA repair protein RecN (Recombination protein N)|nr:DNA repair protein RecN [Deltaproteobacteria bacterium]
MLSELQVKNLALIERLSLSFGPGANILTGETGAGKSILAGALGLLRGSKTSADIVRKGADELTVEALFCLEDHEAFAPLFESQGLSPSDEVILKRVVLPSGRSKAYLNGSMITLAQLAKWGEELLAISSQHDQQTLLNSGKQLDFLDAFGKHRELLSEIGKAYRAREQAKDELEKVLAEIQDGTEKKDFYEYQLKEIKKVNPRPGEDDELLEKKNQAKTNERLFSLLDDSLNLLYGDEGLMSKADRLRSLLDKASALDDALKESYETARGLSEEASALAQDLKSYLRTKKSGDFKTDEAEERLSLLSRLKRKYGPTLENVLKRQKELSDALTRLETLGLDKLNLEKQLKSLSAAAKTSALKLHDARLKSAEKLASHLKDTLMVLGFPKLELKIDVKLLAEESLGSDCGPKGGDSVTILFCPNPGEGLKPLSRIASGGELSRVMLALKTAQEPHSDQSLVFDEIDSGLSGAVAEAVATKMAELATRQQIFVITHQPLMAAIQGRHFLAEKNPEGERTLTSVSELSLDKRLEELARMLDGSKPSPQAMALSKRLLGV